MFDNLLKLNEILTKAIVENPDSGIDLNTAEQSQDDMASKDNHWVEAIRSLMDGAELAEAPRELRLPKYLRLVVSKADDGLYTAIVIKDDPEAGDHGEVQTQLMKMTPESMVQALKAKEYISVSSDETPEAEPQQGTDYQGLYEALKDFQGDLHIHLAKSLAEELTKGRKPMPIGTVRYFGGIQYEKHSEGWKPVKHEKAPAEAKQSEPAEKKTEESVKRAPHEMQREEFITDYLKEAEMDRNPKEVKMLTQLHKLKVQNAMAAGKSIPAEVLKQYPEIVGELPETLKTPAQEKTKLFKSVDLNKVPTKRQPEILKALGDTNLVIESMGITFKEGLHFKADNSLSGSTEKNRVKAEYSGGSGNERTITLKSGSGASKSILHEIGHALDYALAEGQGINKTRSEEASGITNSQLNDKYAELLLLVKNSKFYNIEWEASERKYLNTPTEVFARAFEVYAHTQASKLIKENKISPSFLENYIPDVFKTSDSEKVTAEAEKAYSEKISELMAYILKNDPVRKSSEFRSDSLELLDNLRKML